MISKATRCEFKLAIRQLKRSIKWAINDIKIYFRYQLWNWKNADVKEVQERAKKILLEAEKMLNKD